MTKVSTLAKKAGVKCPKDNGDFDKEILCKLCEHYQKCLRELYRSMM